MKNKQISALLILLIGLVFMIACNEKKNRMSLTFPLSLVELRLSETNYSFAGIVVNNKADHEFTITNTGNKDGLSVTAITSDIPEFTVTSENCTTQALGIGGSCSFNVRFSPAVQGIFKGNVYIASNDLLPRSVALTGETYGLNVWINKADLTNCSDAQVDVTVIGADGPIDSLNIGNHFKLWQNDVERAITSVSTLYNSDPVSVVVALDTSYCMSQALPDMKKNAKIFLDLLDDTDEAAIYSFEHSIEFFPSSSFTPTDAAGTPDLQNFIDNAAPILGGGTALHDAVYDSITRAATGTKGKKAVIVYSDGANDNPDGKIQEDVIAYAREKNVPLFTIFYIDPVNQIRAKPEIMRQLALETGGQDYYADTATMESIFTQIRNMLGSKYTIHYNASPFCSGSIPLRVRADWNNGTNDLYGIDSRTFTIP